MKCRDRKTQYEFIVSEKDKKQTARSKQKRDIKKTRSKHHKHVIGAQLKHRKKQYGSIKRRKQYGNMESIMNI